MKKAEIVALGELITAFRRADESIYSWNSAGGCTIDEAAFYAIGGAINKLLRAAGLAATDGSEPGAGN